MSNNDSPEQDTLEVIQNSSNLAATSPLLGETNTNDDIAVAAVAGEAVGNPPLASTADIKSEIDTSDNCVLATTSAVAAANPPLVGEAHSNDENVVITVAAENTFNPPLVSAADNKNEANTNENVAATTALVAIANPPLVSAAYTNDGTVTSTVAVAAIVNPPLASAAEIKNKVDNNDEKVIATAAAADIAHPTSVSAADSNYNVVAAPTAAAAAADLSLVGAGGVNDNSVVVTAAAVAEAAAAAVVAEGVTVDNVDTAVAVAAAAAAAVSAPATSPSTDEDFVAAAVAAATAAAAVPTSIDSTIEAVLTTAIVDAVTANESSPTDNIETPGLPMTLNSSETNVTIKHEPPSDGETKVVEEGTVSTEPTEYDVLFGRGGMTNSHPGNKRFRDIITLHRPDYVRAIKMDKPAVARKIVRAIRHGNPPGRFLKKCDDGLWYDVGDRTAAEKTSQGLRERTNAEKRERSVLREAQRKHNKTDSDSDDRSLSQTGKGNIVKSSPPTEKNTISKTQTTVVVNMKSDDNKQHPKKKNEQSEQNKSSPFEHNTAGLPPNAVDKQGNILVSDYDILFGRGGLTNHHKGNKRFRDIVALHRNDYVRAPKIQKPSVARVIVRAIRNGDPPGRFLRKDEKTGKWVDVGDKKAAEKTSQALREKTNDERDRMKSDSSTGDTSQKPSSVVTFDTNELLASIAATVAGLPAEDI